MSTDAMPSRPVENQSFLRCPLSHVFAAGSHVKVLRWLARQRRPLTVSQLGRLTGLSAQGVRNVIAALASQGLVSTLGEGRTQVHALRPEHPLGPALLALFEAERTRWHEVTEELHALLKDGGAVQAAWVYGSVARSSDTPGSDLDLVVIMSDDAPRESASSIRDALADFGTRQDIQVSAVLLSRTEAEGQVHSPSPWWQSVMQDALPVLGADPVSLFMSKRPAQPAASAASS